MRPSDLRTERPRALSEEHCWRDAPWQPHEHHEAAPTRRSLSTEKTSYTGEPDSRNTQQRGPIKRKMAWKEPKREKINAN